jgi:hypothetical protein
MKKITKAELVQKLTDEIMSDTYNWEDTIRDMVSKCLYKWKKECLWHTLYGEEEIKDA